MRGAEVDGAVLVAAFAWAGTLQKVAECPSGTAHTFWLRMGSQRVQMYNGHLRGTSKKTRTG